MSLKSLIQQLDADGHRAEAALSLRRALALTPYDGELHDWHGVFAQDRALELSQFADANDPAVLRTLDSALASFQLALRLAPRRSDAYFHAGAALGGATVGRRAEAAAIFAAGAALDPLHPGLVSNHAFRLISNVRALEGAALLRIAVSTGVWERPWQAPGATFARGLWSRPIFARDDFACVLDTLEAAAPAMAAEATALLPEFAVQAEGLATPAAGWRELNVLARCLGGADGRAPVRRSCSALNEVVRRAGGGFSLGGAAFSAIAEGTSLSAHCGSTNERLVVHVGLSVPRPGSARLRLGEPSAVAAARASGGGGAADDWSHEEAWAAGRAFAFDDSFAHEVLWRDDGGQPLPPPDEAQLEDGATFATRARPRVVLILTFRHPGLQAAPVCPSESA